MTISVLDHHMREFDRKMTLAHSALNDGDLALARKQLNGAGNDWAAIESEASFMEGAIEDLENEIDEAEEMQEVEDEG
jgi:hypothetical protein